MTNRTLTRTPDRPAPITTDPLVGPAATPPPFGRHHEAHSTQSIRRVGFTAGVALLVLAVLSAVAVLVVVYGLTTPGDAAATAENITASEGTFRLAVGALYVVIVLDVVVAWALFRFFASVDSWLSRLAAWLRVAYSMVFLVAISQLAAVPGMLSDAGYQDTFGERQLQAQVMLKLEA